MSYGHIFPLFIDYKNVVLILILNKTGAGSKPCQLVWSYHTALYLAFYYSLYNSLL